MKDSTSRFQCTALLSLICLLCLKTAANAQATITSLQPASCLPGETTKLTLRGSKLPSNLRVLTNRTEAKVQIESVTSDQAIVSIAVSSDAKLGPLSLWFASPSGPLPSRIVLVDDLPTVLDNGNNHTAATAQPVSTLGAIDGVSEGSKSDYYKITVAAGQRVARTSDVVFDIAVRPSQKGAADPATQTTQPAGNEIAIASADGLIRIVNTDTMAETRTIANHADWVTSIAWSDDGSRLVSGSRDKSAKVFDANTGELLVSYPGHAAAVRGVAFLPDGKQVYSAGTDKKLHRWDAVTAKKSAEVSVGGEVYKIVRGDTFVFVPSADNQLRRINQIDNKVTQTLAGYQDWVLSTCYHAGTNQIAGGAMNGEVRLWNATDGTLIRNWIAKP